VLIFEIQIFTLAAIKFDLWGIPYRPNQIPTHHTSTCFQSRALYTSFYYKK